MGLIEVGAASVGVSFVYAKKFISPLHIAPEALTTHQIRLALPWVTDLNGITDLADNRRALLGLVVGLGLLGTGLAYLLHYFIVENLGAVTASSATYIPPVVALAIGWLLVDEPLQPLDGLAVLLILIGIAVLRTAARAPAAPS